MFLLKIQWAANGARTRDLDLGKVALYQLSYCRLHYVSAKVVLNIVTAKTFTLFNDRFKRGRQDEINKQKTISAATVRYARRLHFVCTLSINHVSFQIGYSIYDAYTLCLSDINSAPVTHRRLSDPGSRIKVCEKNIGRKRPRPLLRSCRKGYRRLLFPCFLPLCHSILNNLIYAQHPIRTTGSRPISR